MKKFYWQERVWTCGPAAFRTALHRLEIRKSEKYFSNILSANPRIGTSIKKFPKAAKKMNLKYLQGKGDLKLLKKLQKDKYQIIINYFSKLHNGGHYAVVNKISKDRIYLADPASGPNISFSKNYFKKNWHSSSKKYHKWFFAVKK